MPQQGITLPGGGFVALPGAYYVDNVSAAAPNTPPTTPPLLFIGYGWGPKPQTPVTFTSAQALLVALRGGPAANFVPFIANPSPALNGAQLITFIDASTNTQANAALLTSGGTIFANLTSALYGPPSNRLQYQISSASVSGVRLALIDNYSGGEVVGDNLTAPFEVTAASGITGLTYSATSGATSGTFALNSGATGLVSFALGSGNYQTVAQLVQAINGTAYATASILSATNGTLPANYLTPTGSSPVVVSSGAPTAVRAYGQDLLWWVNTFAYSYATAVSSGGYADTLAALPVSGQPTYFSGAAGNPPVTAGYAAALNVGLTQAAWTVFCDANTPAVQALLAQHCETASSAPYGMWRRGFTGSSIGDSVATTEANALALDSLQMNYLYPGIYAINTTTGLNTLYGGLYAAAAAAAIATGNQIALPLTNKVLNGTGLEQPGGTTITASQLASLQNAGVMALWTPPQTLVPTILSDVTTWQADNNAENTSSQQVACRYWLAYSVTNILNQYVGTIADPVDEANIIKALTQLLNSLIYTGSGSNGVLASWQKGSIVLTYTGSNQTAAITFNAILVGQNRYITVYASILPLNFTISSSSSTSSTS